jgi:DNA-binding LacI/PurR family transcriptional regulator
MNVIGVVITDLIIKREMYMDILTDVNDIIEKLRYYQQLSDVDDEQQEFEEMIQTLNKVYDVLVNTGVEYEE